MELRNKASQPVDFKVSSSNGSEKTLNVKPGEDHKSDLSAFHSPFSVDAFMGDTTYDYD